MALTTVGRNFIAEALMNDSTPTFFDNTNSYLGVGDSTTEFAAAQTDLQAVTNKFRKAMEATYPQRTDNALVFKAIFATDQANFAWNEWGIFNNASAGVMLNRVVSGLGTKAAGSWALTVTLTVTAS